MTPREFEKRLAEIGPADVYRELTGRPDWGSAVRGLIPPHMQSRVVRWIAYGSRIRPGSFLEAVIANDLGGAVRRADDENRKALIHYIEFFYNYAPSGSRYPRWPGLFDED